MNKITKPILVSALSALAFGAVGVAGTFALFTDGAETQITAAAGIVKASIGFGDGIATYSAKASSGASYDVTDEFGGKYDIVETEVNGTFTNGGTASIDTQGYLSLNKITPGDKVAFTVNPSSTGSTVDIQYRLTYAVVQNQAHNMDLAKGLVTTIGSKSYVGLENYQSGWTLAKLGGASLSGVDFTIELPITAGNQYQDKSATIALGIEAVQGNAAVFDSAYAKCYDDGEAEEVVPATGNTVVEATNKAQTATVKTTIPAATTQISAGDTVKLLVSDVETKENTSDPTYTDLEFDASLYVNNVKVTEFSQAINVEVQLPTDLVISGVKHRGNPVTNYAYNSETGKLTFSTSSFSPFVVTYKVFSADVYNVSSASELQTTLDSVGNGTKPVIINLAAADYGDVTIYANKNTTSVGVAHTNGIDSSIDIVHRTRDFSNVSIVGTTGVTMKSLRIGNGQFNLDSGTYAKHVQDPNNPSGSLGYEWHTMNISNFKIQGISFYGEGIWALTSVNVEHWKEYTQNEGQTPGELNGFTVESCSFNTTLSVSNTWAHVNFRNDLHDYDDSLNLPVKNVEIKDCTFGSVGNDQSSNVYVSRFAEDFAVTGCTFNSVGQTISDVNVYAAYNSIQVATGARGNFIVKNNSFQGVKKNYIRWNGVSTVLGQPSSWGDDSDVSGNSFYNCTGRNADPSHMQNYVYAAESGPVVELGANYWETLPSTTYYDASGHIVWNAGEQQSLIA